MQRRVRESKQTTLSEVTRDSGTFHKAIRRNRMIRHDS
jgi:hypothetical protein